MSYVKETLASGEEVIQIARFNWTYYAPAWFWFLLGSAPLAYGAYAQVAETLPGDPKWIFGIAAVPAVLGALILIGHFIHVKTTEIAVTTTRFVFKTGLISRTTKEVSLNKIEEIRLNQSILGRLFGFGQLTLHGTGVGKIELPEIDNPVEFRRAIETSKARLRDPDDQDFAITPPSRTAGHGTAPGHVHHGHVAAQKAPAKKQKKTRFLQKKKRARTMPAVPDLPEKLR